MISIVAEATRQAFEFVGGARPVGTEQAREGAVGKEFAACLALRTIVGFVRGVANALHTRAAARARLLVFSVHCHLGTKSGDMLREADGGSSSAGMPTFLTLRHSSLNFEHWTLEFGRRRTQDVDPFRERYAG